jgi:HPt (histidine-containing phosphotransfer) domain-containing protein
MPVIDQPTFEELKQMSGDDFINELIDTFLEDAPKMIAEIKSALQAKDAETFRRGAHSMKSNANTFGATQLAALSKELEMLGKENKLPDNGDQVQALEEAYASVREELKRLKS